MCLPSTLDCNTDPILLYRRNKRVAPVPDEAGDETHSEPDIEGEAVSLASSKKRKTNSKGLVILGNGVVAMRDLDLASRVPTKTKDDDTPNLYNASLTLSKAFTQNHTETYLILWIIYKTFLLDNLKFVLTTVLL